MYKSATHIITVGNGYKENIVAKGIDKEKLSVVTNGVSLDSFIPTVSNLRENYNCEEKFVCSYIGTVGMAHGLDVVINAAKTLQDLGDLSIEFWIVGDGARRAALEKMAGVLDLRNIRFLGKLPKEKMPEVISSSDAVLVHLNKSDLFTTVIPSKIFEFMAMEVPIIMGVEGESRNLVLSAQAGESMEPENSNDLIKAITLIKKNGRDHYKGHDFVAENFNRDTLAQTMLNIVFSRSK